MSSILSSLCSVCLHNKVCGFQDIGTRKLDATMKELDDLYISGNKNPITVSAACSSFLPIYKQNDPNASDSSGSVNPYRNITTSFEFDSKTNI